MAQRTGGPATVMVHSTLALGDAVERVIVCTDAGAPAAAQYRPVTRDDMPEGAERLDIRVFPTQAPRKAGYAPALGRFLVAEAPSFDLVTIHSLNLYPQYAAYRAARKHRVPYIVVPHGAMDPWLRSQRRARKVIADVGFQRDMLNRAAALHFTTAQERDRSGLRHPRSRVVPNGVSLDAVVAPAGAGTRFRQTHGISTDELVVTFLGRIAAKKGVDVLIRAFAASGVSGRLVIVGPDDEGLTPGLRRLAEEMGVASRIHFVGPQYEEDRAAALAATDIWALLSHTENFGNAVVEAMAASCPVIVSEGVNISSAIAQSGAGVVVAGTSDAGARALAELAADPDTRRSLAQRGRAFAESYSWPHVAEQLLGLYREAASRR